MDLPDSNQYTGNNPTKHTIKLDNVGVKLKVNIYYIMINLVIVGFSIFMRILGLVVLYYSLSSLLSLYYRSWLGARGFGMVPLSH